MSDWVHTAVIRLNPWAQNTWLLIFPWNWKSCILILRTQSEALCWARRLLQRWGLCSSLCSMSLFKKQSQRERDLENMPLGWIGSIVLLPIIIISSIQHFFLMKAALATVIHALVMSCSNFYNALSWRLPLNTIWKLQLVHNVTTGGLWELTGQCSKHNSRCQILPIKHYMVWVPDIWKCVSSISSVWSQIVCHWRLCFVVLLPSEVYAERHGTELFFSFPWWFLCSF